jgi:hypothetical protein
MSATTVHRKAQQFIDIPTWQVEKRPLFDQMGNKLPTYGVFRTDNNRFLDNVGPIWQPIQTSSILSLSDSMIKSGMKMKMFAVRVLDNGRIIEISYKLDKTILVTGNDKTDTFLTFRIHHGIGSVISMIETLREICTNGLRIGESERAISVRHTANAEFRLSEGEKILRNSLGDVQRFGEKLNEFASVKLPVATIGKVIEKFYFKADDDNIYTNTRKQDQARQILMNFEHNDGDANPKIRGTAFALLNSFTYFADHQMRTRKMEGETEEQSMMRSQMIGSAAQFKARALSTIESLVK